MNSSFCPKCGRDTDVLYNTVCRECYISIVKLLECPQVLYLRICPKCGSFFRKGRWSSREDETEVMREIVIDNLETNREAQNLELIIIPEQLDPSRYRVHVEAHARINGIPVDEELYTEVRINRETCDSCSRISGGYFEGLIQIRGDRRVPGKEELETCQCIARDVSVQALEKGDRFAFITKVVELDEGRDLYVGSRKLGKQICRAIINSFGGSFSESPKLVGQKDGVNLYRVTFAIRLPEFMRGDIISVNDKVIEVQSCGKHIRGIDLETGKRFTEEFDSQRKVEKLGRKEDAVSAVFISEEGSTIQVLDPDTYETVTIKKPDFLGSQPGSEIKIIKTSKGIYVLP
jgi:nonsense-mediated mRNA decay protein 3